MTDDIDLPPLPKGDLVDARDGHVGYTAEQARDIQKDAIKADRQRRGELVACPSCGTHEVSLERTCHNSSCCDYAKVVTVHEGWKNAMPKAAPKFGEEE